MPQGLRTVPRGMRGAREEYATEAKAGEGVKKQSEKGGCFSGESLLDFAIGGTESRTI